MACSHFLSPATHSMIKKPRPPFEINLSIVAAVLTIVGYSMNDTVVIFDRVRENLRKYADIKIFVITNISIN